MVYDIDFKGRLGPERGDTKVVRLLNRIIEWQREGIKMEAAPRHAELFISQLGLEDVNPLSAPPDKRNPKNFTSKDIEELNGGQASNYRAMVARANYLSIDRSDIRFSVKELARRMSKPRKIDWEQLVLFGRYLRGKMRVVGEFNYQKQWKIIDVWSDTDHAGCLEIRKSTTGGVLMLGSHCIKHWSSTQTLISLSSGEAEYYGFVGAASQTIGFKSMMNDLGIKRERIRLKTDASVAQSLASRRRLGDIRHTEVNQLWLEDEVGEGDVEIEKVRGTVNRADALAKPVRETSS